MPINSLVLSILILSGIPSISKAQEPQKNPQRKDRIESFKVAFLTRKMDLTPKEAEQFWPVYNEFNKKLQAIEEKIRSMRNITDQQLEKMTDKEIEDVLAELQVNIQKMVDLKKQFHEDIKKILPIKKVAKYYLAERAFKEELVKMAIEKREQKKK